MADDAWGSEEAGVEALFVRLREEIAAREPAAASRRGPPDGVPASPGPSRSEAERVWAVTADRPFLYKPGRWGRIRGLLLVPVKSLLRKLMRWYVEPAFAQQRDFNARALKALDELSARMDERADDVGDRVAAADVRLTEQLAAADAKLTEQLAAADARVTEGLAGATAELEAAIEPLRHSLGRIDTSLTEVDERLLRVERRIRQQGEPARDLHVAEPSPAKPAEQPDYFAFESRMRGSSRLIRERQSVYADEFREAAPVLDVGCGRGEFLTLLREAGVEARGVDVDPDMVAHCRGAGLAVAQADGAAYLSGLGDGSLGGIFCAHVLEHLDPSALFSLLGLAAAKLRPSGLFVAETPNPLSLVALANFSADLSHERPLHPSTLSFLARQAGFRDVTLQFMSEPAEDERLRLVPLPEELGEAQEVLDANVNRLNDVVFGPQDYALLART